MSLLTPNDQASRLRQKMVKKSEGLPSLGPPILALASGKGGVGKSTLAINLAWKLSERQKKVLLFDADFGLGNTDILLGITPSCTLTQALQEGKRMDDIVHKLNPYFSLIPAGSGHFATANANPFILEGLCHEMERYSHSYDWVMVDTGAGIGERVLGPLLLADQIVIVTTPDPTSITDSYATIKMVSQHNPNKVFKVLVNMADEEGGKEVFNKLNRVSQKYLNIALTYWGNVPQDQRAAQAVRNQTALCKAYPSSVASKAITSLCHGLLNGKAQERNSKIWELIGFLSGQEKGSWGEASVA